MPLVGFGFNEGSNASFASIISLNPLFPTTRANCKEKKIAKILAMVHYTAHRFLTCIFYGNYSDCQSTAIHKQQLKRISSWQKRCNFKSHQELIFHF